MTVYGNNAAIPSFAQIKDLSTMMKNGKSLTMGPENHNHSYLEGSNNIDPDPTKIMEQPTNSP